MKPVAHRRKHVYTCQPAGRLGGWPGAWFAQQLLRHKSSKASFRATYWATVALHGIVLAGWLFQSSLQRALLNI